MTELDPVHTNHFRLRITARFFARLVLQRFGRPTRRQVRYSKMPFPALFPLTGLGPSSTSPDKSSRALLGAHRCKLSFFKRGVNHGEPAIGGDVAVAERLPLGSETGRLDLFE